MQNSPTLETCELDAEEFLRLGVRPDECRLLVIRRATVVAAKALADKQLLSPTPQVERQLSRVVTSAYRILDPRKRSDFIQRIQIGRMQPNGSSWPIHLSFRIENLAATSQSLASDDPSNEVAFPFDGDTDSDVLSRTSSLVPSSLVPYRSIADLTKSLGDEDLVIAGARRRRIAALRRSIQHPWLLVSLLGLLVGTTITLSRIDFGPDEFKPTRIDPSPVLASSFQPPATQITPVVEPLPISTETIDAAPDRSNHAETIDVSTILDSQLESPHVDAKPEEALSLKPQSDLELEQGAETASVVEMDIADKVLSKPTDWESSYESIIKSPIASSVEAQADGGYLPDPFESSMIAPDGSPRSDEAPAIKIPAITAPSKPIQDAGTPPVSAERLSAARVRIKQALPLINTHLRPEQITELIRELKRLSKQFDETSDESFAIEVISSEHAWIISQAPLIRARLSLLSTKFGVNLTDLLVDSYLSSILIADLFESREHLANEGLFLAEELLRAGEIDRCNEVVNAVLELTKLTANEVQSNEVARLFAALEQCSKLGQSLISTDGEAIEKATETEIGIAGRYFCLLLGQWDRGLPWLVKTHDPRIAGLARQELELTSQSSPEDWNSAANRWLIAADRSEGRSADVIRMHVIEMKRKLLDSVGALAKLELDRELEKLTSTLPPTMRRLLMSKSSQIPSDEERVEQVEGATMQRPISGEGSLPAIFPGMLGTVAFDAKVSFDESVNPIQLIYLPGSLLTSETLQKILKVAKIDTPSVMIEFRGQFELEESKTIRLMASQMDREQDIQVDGEKLEFAGGVGSVELELAKGLHVVLWKVSLNLLSNDFLRVIDVESGDVIELNHEK